MPPLCDKKVASTVLDIDLNGSRILRLRIGKVMGEAVARIE
jgi:hypothetical protein